MQGTLVMLVALSGLGCYNKGCDVAYVPPTYACFAGGCYANWYPGPVMPSCYAGCYGGCYSGAYGGCYAGWGGAGFGSWCGGGFASCYGGGCYTGCHRRFGCGMGLFGLFGCCHKRVGCGGYGYGGMGWYGGSYAPPVFGSALGMSYGPVTGATGAETPGTTGTQAPSAPTMGGRPTEVTPPVQPSQVPQPTITPPAEVAPARPVPAAPPPATPPAPNPPQT
jgi:hypothetical protein